jgi:hypothetical protein
MIKYLNKFLLILFIIDCIIALYNSNYSAFSGYFCALLLLITNMKIIKRYKIYE